MSSGGGTFRGVLGGSNWLVELVETGLKKASVTAAGAQPNGLHRWVRQMRVRD